MQYKRCGLRNGTKEFCLMVPRPAPQKAKSGQSPEASFSVHMVDKKQGGHMADKVWRHSQSGHKADTGRDMADT